MIRKIVVCFLLGIVLAALPAAAEELTLDKAVDLALKQNYSLRDSQYQADAADWGFAQSFSAWLPHVTYDTSWSKVDDQTYNDAEQQYQRLKQMGYNSQRTVYKNNYASAINVIQPIFNGGQEYTTIRSAFLARRGARLGEQDTRLQTVLNTKKAYYTVLKTRALQDVARESLDLAHESLRLAQARLQVGSGTQSDLLRWEAESATAEGSLAEAENAYSQALMSLANIIGGPVEAEWTLPDIDLAITAEQLQLAEQASLAGAKAPLSIGSHPAVAAAATNVDLATAGEVGSVGKLLPNVNFTYNYQWETNDTLNPDGNTNWTVGVGVEIPLFQGIGAITGIGNSVRKKQAAEMTAETFNRAFLQQAYSSRFDLKSARLRVLSARKAVEFSQSNLEIVEKRSELGMATSLEQLDAQIAYQKARSDLIGAVGDFRIALAEWDYVTATKE